MWFASVLVLCPLSLPAGGCWAGGAPSWKGGQVAVSSCSPSPANGCSDQNSTFLLRERPNPEAAVRDHGPGTAFALTGHKFTGELGHPKREKIMRGETRLVHAHMPAVC